MSPALFCSTTHPDAYQEGLRSLSWARHLIGIECSLLAVGSRRNCARGVVLVPPAPAAQSATETAGTAPPVGCRVSERGHASGGGSTSRLRGGSQWLRIGRYQLPVGGDVITAVDGQPTADLEALTVYLETETSIGDTVELTVVRDGEENTIPLTLREEPQA